MSLTRQLGTTLPEAEATMSTCPKMAQISARTKSATMVMPIERPIGDGGVSTISSAAGRKASSSFSRRSRFIGNDTTFFVASIAALADLMDATLQPVKVRVASAGPYQVIVSTILNETP